MLRLRVRRGLRSRATTPKTMPIQKKCKSFAWTSRTTIPDKGVSRESSLQLRWYLGTTNPVVTATLCNRECHRPCRQQLTHNQPCLPHLDHPSSGTSNQKAQVILEKRLHQQVLLHQNIITCFPPKCFVLLFSLALSKSTKSTCWVSITRTVVSYQNENFSSKWELPSCSLLPP